MTLNDVAGLSNIIRNTREKCTNQAFSHILKADKHQEEILELGKKEKDLMQGLQNTIT